jgi:hypothetical protein
MIRVALLMLIASIASASDTARIDGVIVTTGMTTGEVLKRAGQPDAREDVQNVYGAVLGSRWEYYGKTRMVTLWIQRGKVVRIDDE